MNGRREVLALGASSSRGVSGSCLRAVLLCCLGACQPAPIEVYHSLLAPSLSLETQEGRVPRPLVVGINGDYRSALFQHPPSRLFLGPLPHGEDCEFRFGIGVKGGVWTQSDGVGFRVALREGGEERTLYQDFLDTQTIKAGWQERAIPLGDLARSPGFDLVLETNAGPAQDQAFDQAAWSEPHIRCAQRQGLPRSRSQHNVVLVSIDTLRADHLGIYGYPERITPTLDTLASEGVVFTEAFSTAPWTLPSHASMFTGLFPHEHEAGHLRTSEPLHDSHRTLAEVLLDAGYRTVGVSGGGYAGARYGLSQGFETWIERPRANLRSVLPEVMHQLVSSPERPFFLFLHTYDVHGPYASWTSEVVSEPSEIDKALPRQEWERIRSIPYHAYHRFDRFSGLSDVRAAYAEGVQQVDRQLGRFFSYLRDLGIYEETLIVITSDHGESLYDNRLYIGHSYTVRDEEVRVPLIVRLPGGKKRGYSEELVSLVDIAPLIYDVLDLRGVAKMSGRNPLVAYPGASAERVLLGEAMHVGKRFARSLEWKVVSEAWPLDDPRSQLPEALADRFDGSARAVDLRHPNLGREPIDLDRGSSPSDGRVKDLWRMIQAMPEPARRQGAAEPVLDAESTELLEALGYLQ